MVFLGDLQFIPGDEIPGAIADKIIWILPDRTLQDLSPVLQILPCLIDSSASEWWESSQSLEVHAAQTPVIYGELVLFTLKNFGSHVIRRAHD